MSIHFRAIDLKRWKKSTPCWWISKQHLSKKKIEIQIQILKSFLLFKGKLPPFEKSFSVHSSTTDINFEVGKANSRLAGIALHTLSGLD